MQIELSEMNFKRNAFDVIPTNSPACHVCGIVTFRRRVHLNQCKTARVCTKCRLGFPSESALVDYLKARALFSTTGALLGFLTKGGDVNADANSTKKNLGRDVRNW